MEAKDKTTPHKPKERQSIFANTYDDIIGIAMTIGSGVGAGWMIINKHFFKNAEKENLLKKPRTDRDSARTAAHQKGLVGDELRHEITAVEKKYERDVAAKLGELGIKGPIKKWATLRHHQKAEVVLAMAAVSAAAIGFVSNYVSNRVGSKKQAEIEARLDAFEARQQHNSVQ